MYLIIFIAILVYPEEILSEGESNLNAVLHSYGILAFLFFFLSSCNAELIEKATVNRGNSKLYTSRVNL